MPTAYTELLEQGLVSDEERQSFEHIMQLAQAGPWDTAQAASLQFARDQVR